MPFASAALRGELASESFEAPQQTIRYVAGGALMGAGCVVVGGCILGASLSGSTTLSIAALIGLASITAGGIATAAALRASGTAQAA